MTTTTLNQLFKNSYTRYAARPALGWKTGGAYQYITYAELDQRVRNLALGLIALGVQPGDRVALLSENRWEWAVSDLAILRAGAATTPLYSTLPAKQVEDIVRDAGARVLIVSDAEQFAKALEVKAELPAIEKVLVMADEVSLGDGEFDWALRWREVLEGGAARLDEIPELERRAEAVQPDDLASLIYTSGTTGEPKGAMLTHNNFASNAVASGRALAVTPDDAFQSFLPLAHVFERLCGHYLPLTEGASIGYTESMRTLQLNLSEIKPTVLLGVPRIWELLMAGIQAKGRRLKGLKRAAFDKALEVGMRVGKARLAGKQPSLLDKAALGLLDKKVLSEIRHALGGRLRLCASGGAALPPAVGEFFFSLGIVLVEGFGLTETSPVICMSRPPVPRIGTVGTCIDGVEVRIAADGEILSRGPNVMKGYWNKPEATTEAIDADGWFHTGDIGVIERDGSLRIADRKKNILVLANGKNVAPTLVETTLLRSAFIAQIVVFGDQQSALSALIVPNSAALREWAQTHGLGAATDAELCNAPEVTRLIRGELERTSGDLADYEHVKRFKLLPMEFTIEAGELTPTMKIKRKVVAEKFAAELAAMAD